VTSEVLVAGEISVHCSDLKIESLTSVGQNSEFQTHGAENWKAWLENSVLVNGSTGRFPEILRHT